MAASEREYTLTRDGVELAHEVHPGVETWYHPREIRTMLEITGYTDIEITGDYTGEPIGPQHRWVMGIKARRKD